MTEQGLALFDAATARDEAAIVPMHFNEAAQRALGVSVALFRALLGEPGDAAPSADKPGVTMADRLRSLDPAEQEKSLRDLVVKTSAVLLGHTDESEVDGEKDFLELGFDSLIAVELRNQLADMLGIKVPSSVVFDNKTPNALGKWLFDELLDQPVQGGAASTATAGASVSSTPTTPCTACS